MAYLTVNYVSRSLMRTVPVNVILPADKLVFPGQPEPENKPFRMPTGSTEPGFSAGRRRKISAWLCRPEIMLSMSIFRKAAIITGNSSERSFPR